jgi:hypothetical protein
MAGGRRALIVATDQYSDPKLTSLKAPATDARALAEVLRDDAVGCFEVQTVLNRPSHEIELAIAEFFGSGRYGDTLLAHFSCHGVKSPTGELYFAATDTSLSDTFRLKVTGVPSALVRDAMEESRASLILCLVDCCYSGAFVKLAKAADTVDLTERLGGKGRAVITASTSLQLALDGEEEPSLFTRAVIEGLQSGEADRDLDGLVSLDELYSFVHERVSSLNPNQTPVKSFDVQGEVYVARRSTPVTEPAALDPGLLADARAQVVYQRLGAVRGLAAVLDEGHPGRVLAARLELERLAREDDSLSVRGEARKVLDSAGDLPAPPIPELRPGQGGARGSWPPPTGGSSGEDRGGEPVRHRPARVRRRVLVGLGLAAAVLVGGAVWWAAGSGGSGGGGSGGGSGGEAGGPVLPDTEVLLGGTDPQLGHGILAFDVATGQTRMVLHDKTAGLPTISEDRRWMVYLTKADGGTVPRLARVDGSEAGRLLHGQAARECPYANRPAFSPDGDQLAVICLDVDGNYLGLGTVHPDGSDPVPLTDDDQVRGSPTWTDDGRIVYMRDLHGDGTTTLWAIPADGGTPQRVTSGLDGSDSHPDWSGQGLLFLRTQGGLSDVFYKTSLDARGVTRITTDGKADSPAWAPGDAREVIWVERSATGEATLWTKELGSGSPTELSTGAYGPPAWGSR